MQHQSREHININLKVGKGAPSYLYRIIEDALTKGITTFKIRIKSPEKGIYPNFCVPIAGIIKYFEDNRSCSFLSSKSLDEKHYAGRVGILHPCSNTESLKKNCFLDKVLLFNRDNQYQVVEGIRSSLQQSAVMQKGILNCIELCLNEVMDNVLVHSCSGHDNVSPYGLVMAQVHTSGNRIAIAVYDNGVGMMRSLQNGGIAIDNPKEAISSALQKGITDGRGKGNGLWLLNEIVKEGRGSLEITSNGVRYSLWHQQFSDEQAYPKGSFSKISSTTSRATLVDFQICTDEAVNINRIMGKCDFVDLWKENHEDLENEFDHRLSVLNDSAGLGTRYDASGLRMLALNTMSDTDGYVILDFSGIEIISFSFADEAIRKLRDIVGIETFTARFRLTGLNDNCRTIINLVMDDSMCSNSKQAHGN